MKYIKPELLEISSSSLTDGIPVGCCNGNKDYTGSCNNGNQNTAGTCNNGNMNSAYGCSNGNRFIFFNNKLFQSD